MIMRKNDTFDAKIVNTRLTKIFIAIFAPDERLPSSAPLISHQSALLPIKIALFLGIPFLMGKGYCSSTDWPNVSRFDGNSNKH